MSTATTVRRAGELARNLAFVGSTVAHHVVEDPLLLAVQASRRLPRRWVTAAAHVLTPGAGGPRHHSVRAAYAAWLTGHPADAARIVRAVAATHPSGVRAQLLAELAAQVGVDDVGASAGGPDAGSGGAARSLRARAAWSDGDLTRALAEARSGRGGSFLEARLASELALLRGWRADDGASSGTGQAPSASAASAAAGATAPTATTPGREQLAAFHVLTNSLPHTQSGYTLRSHAVLRAQQSAGIRVMASTRLGYPVAIGVVGARHRDVVDGVTYQRCIPTRAAADARARVRQQVELLLPVVDEFRPDVLHTTTNYANALVTQSLARHVGLPWVYEVRGLLEETWVAGRPTEAARRSAAESERYRLLRERETELAQAADHVVTLSETLRRELVGRGVDGARITVVPNAVDAALLDRSAASAAARGALGLPVDGFWVGTVSSLVEYEGLDTVIDAVAALRARGLDARGLIVGDGVSRPALERRAREAGVAAHLTFTGRVPRDRAADHHEALDVFVVPRRDVRVARHVTPLKPIEAMACGRPVVVSDLPALRELVLPHGSGRVVPPDDAEALADELARLAGSTEERERLAAAGRAFAASRTWGAAGETYRRLYGALVGRVAA
ncbi:glycosyltransferase family 4 protein [Cellulomonas fimi]|uniref:D-inositol 3-phosphate glycosyltransferase n=1 Tax=Cellulomonas fimi TaxID=1708 RepID=A0A7Y0QHU5_CELFI|nr:glycosyltransferase family 4 protein [Cellulomonas fimi]NMR20523.1 glycosyltransferase [Cellulomonas fimi]